jgi:hypothetical protein
LATATTSPSGLPVARTYNGGSSSPVNAGSYAVVAAITDANYAGSTSGTLTIAPASQTITFGALAAKRIGEEAFPLSATASSGLPVSFSGGNPSVATISGNIVTLVGSGSAVITASQGGDSNYSAAASVTQMLTLTVDDAPPGELLIAQTPDGLNQRLRFSFGPGRHWQLQATADSFHWDTLCELDAVTNGWIDVFDPIIPSRPNWSYRLVSASLINTNQGADVVPGALLLSRTDTPPNMQLRFSIGANRHWQLQASEDFLHWTILCELTALTNGWIDTLDRGFPARSARFYRITSAPTEP